MSVAGGLATALSAAATARATVRALTPLVDTRPDGWSRTNHRGRAVSLAAGPAAAAGLAVPLAVAAAGRRDGDADGSRLLAAGSLLAVAAAAVGRYDDTAGARPGQRADKGVRGHLRALRSGRVTAGAVKVVGIGAAAVGGCAAAGVGRHDLAPSALLVAGGANLVNLFDLRPGRALKVACMPALVLAAVPRPAGGPADLVGAASLGVVAALLPDDLHERTMLGDAGANALGAVLSLGCAVRSGPRTRAAALTGVLALTAASEVVSFSRVIEAVGPLARLDRLGRLPA